MAMLLDSIATSGVRRSDGTPAASGFVFLYMPGTTNLVSGYRDNALSQTWTTTNGGIQLDASGRATIWVGQKVDVVINDASGAVVATLLGYNGIPAPVVEIQNAGFTGALTDPATGNVTQGAGGLIDEDTVLSRAYSSFGGVDWQYQESPGATPRKYRDVVRSFRVSPEDFGAAANGKSDDTVAILSAISELGRLGGGVLAFSPATYAVSANIQIGLSGANAQGISLVGAGSGASVLLWTAGFPGFLFYGTKARITGLSLTNNIAGGDVNSIYLDLENSVNVVVDDVVTDANCRIGCQVRGASEVMLRSSTFVGANGDALSEGLVISGGSGIRAIGNSIIGGSSGVGVYCPGNSGSGYLLEGNTFSNCGLAGIVMQGTLGAATIRDNPTLSSLSTPFLPVTTTYRGLTGAYPSPFYQEGNGLDGSTANILTGGLATPDIGSGGRYFRFVGTTTGSAYNVAAVTWVPYRGQVITMEFVNAAGGAVTGWSFDSSYKTIGSVPTTDAHSVSAQFSWDGSKWRQLGAFADTTT